MKCAFRTVLLAAVLSVTLGISPASHGGVVFSENFNSPLVGWEPGPNNTANWTTHLGQLYAVGPHNFTTWSPLNDDYLGKSFPEVSLNDFNLTLQTTFDSGGPNGQLGDENALAVGLFDASGTSGYIFAMTRRTASSYVGAWIKRIDNGVMTPTPADEGGIYNTGLLIWDRYTPPGYTTESRRIYDQHGNMISNTPTAHPWRLNDNVQNLALSRVGNDLTFTMTGRNLMFGQSISLTVTDPHDTPLTDFGNIKLSVFNAQHGYRFDRVVLSDGETGDRPGFGRQWLRENPFTIMGAAIGNPPPMPALNMNTYMGMNMTAVFANNSFRVAEAAANAELPWHMNLSPPRPYEEYSGGNQVQINQAINYGFGKAWMLPDEPITEEEIQNLAASARWMNAEHPEMLIYVTVFQSDSATLNNIVGTIKPDLLMFDQYPFKEGGVTDQNRVVPVGDGGATGQPGP